MRTVFLEKVGSNAPFQLALVLGIAIEKHQNPLVCTGNVAFD